MIVGGKLKFKSPQAHHNIGIAVDSEHGLLLPCVKGVEAMSVIEIAEELARLQKNASDNKLSPSDMSGGTFSLSNIGSVSRSFARFSLFSFFFIDWGNLRATRHFLAPSCYRCDR